MTYVFSKTRSFFNIFYIMWYNICKKKPSFRVPVCETESSTTGENMKPNLRRSKMDLKEQLQQGIIIKLLGDSITAGAGSSDDYRCGEEIIVIDGVRHQQQLGQQCFASLFAQYIKNHYPGNHVINYGCSGINSTQLRAHLTELIEKDDDVILLMIGTNNRKLSDGMSILSQDLSYIIDEAQKMNKMVILMMANPVTQEDEQYENRLFHQEEVNKVVKQVAQSKSVLFVNYYEWIQGYLLKQQQTIEELMAGGDGLHPTDRVYRLMFNHLIDSLKI